MITVEQAHQLIEKNSWYLSAVKVPISEAVGSIIARSVYAKLPLPVADNSAMDGFVLRCEDTKKN